MSEELETNPIGDFIDQIAAKNYNRAQEMFSDLIGDKMNSALEAEKISVAQSIYNQIDDDEDEEDDEDLEYEFDEEDLDVDEEETEEEEEITS
jgi:hypothetical protein